MTHADTVEAFQSIEDLTAPIRFGDYLEAYWSKGFHHLPADEKQKRQADALFSLKDFLNIIHQIHVRHSSFFLSIDGQSPEDVQTNFVRSKLAWRSPPSLPELEKACERGASIVFNQIERYNPKLIDFCRGSMQVLGENVNMNAYFSPAGGQRGLGCHYDIQEHFIIQFSGTKRWRFYEGLVDKPIEKVDFAQGSAQRRPQDRSFTDVIVQPGDILYFARGQWHEPIPTDQHSLHLTVTIPSTFQFRAIQWLHKRLAELENLREFLPHTTQDHTTQKTWKNEVEAVRQQAIHILSSPEFSRQAFFDKFQESFAITSDHRDDTD